MNTRCGRGGFLPSSTEETGHRVRWVPRNPWARYSVLCSEEQEGSCLRQRKHFPLKKMAPAVVLWPCTVAHIRKCLEVRILIVSLPTCVKYDAKNAKSHKKEFCLIYNIFSFEKHSERVFNSYKILFRKRKKSNEV